MGSRFWRAFSAYLASTLGETFYAVAVPLVLLQTGYAAATATFLRTLVMTTTVIAGFLVGHLVDRYAPAGLLGVSYLGSAGALLVGTGAVALGADAYVMALGVAAFLGLFAAVSAAAVDAGVPQLAPEPGRIRHGYAGRVGTSRCRRARTCLCRSSLRVA